MLRAMKRLIITSLLCVSLPAIAGVERNQPLRTIEEVSDGIVVTYVFDNPKIVESEYYENTKYIRYDGFGLNDNDGEPCIPFRNDTYLVPNNCAVSVSVLDSAYIDTTFVLAPSMPLIPDDNSPITTHSITSYAGFFPTNTIQSSGVYQHREDVLINVSISPVKYNYQTHTVRRYSHIKYKLTYSSMSHVYKGKSTSMARKICQNILESRNNADSTIRDDKHYLIITTTEYKNSLDDFVKWKRLKGFNVHISTRTKGDWTVESVTDSIQYHFDNNNTDYLLIVGDIDDVPAEIMYSFEKQGKTDHQYGLPVNNIPQIKRGRIPVNNSVELEFILNKIIRYEQKPVIDEDFYNTALHLAYYQDGENSITDVKDSIEDRAFTLCAEELRNHMTINHEKNIIRGYTHSYGVVPTCWNKGRYSYGDTIPPDLRTGGAYNWRFNANNIKNAIEAGTFYVLYRGHGQEDIWNSPSFPGWHPSTGTIGLPLTNENKLPVIFSVACLTGKYDYNGGDCLAEILLKNQNQEGGCVGMIAATQESPSGYNDAFAYGMFDAIWPGFIPMYGLKNYSTYTSFIYPTYEVGDIMDLGLFRMKETWGNNSTMWKLFHCFGDPSMMLYTENPRPLQDPTIRVIGDTLYVNVIDEECKINIVNNTTNVVQSYLGNAVILYVGDDNISVCIDKHNYVPYVWHKDIYIQDEDIVASNREYHAKNIKVGNHVTDQRPQGNVTITNSNITIKADNVVLDKGTRVNLGSILRVDMP